MKRQRDDDLVARLEQARVQKKTIERITIAHKELTLEDAYQIQNFGIERREKNGEKIVGYKMGLTSREKQEQKR